MRALRVGLLVLLALAVTAGPGWGQAVYRIETIANEVPGPLVFVRMSFWNAQADLDGGKLPECVNDFRMMLPLKNTVAQFDTLGNVISVTMFDADVPKQIKSNIERWWKGTYLTKKAGPVALSPDGKDNRIKVDTEARVGVLARKDVTALVGKTFEVGK